MIRIRINVMRIRKIDNKTVDAKERGGGRGGGCGLLLPGFRSCLCGVEEIPVLELGIVHILQQVGRCRSPATRPGPHN
jgi:hypothetical protein